MQEKNSNILLKYIWKLSISLKYKISYVGKEKYKFH